MGQPGRTVRKSEERQKSSVTENYGFWGLEDAEGKVVSPETPPRECAEHLGLAVERGEKKRNTKGKGRERRSRGGWRRRILILNATEKSEVRRP